MLSMSAIPTDILRKIYVEAIRERHLNVIDSIVSTLANAFDLACSGQTDADYTTPMFPGSTDVAHVSLVYDGAFSRIGIHRYSVHVEVGDELFCLYKDDYENGGENVETDVKLWIANKSSSEKYENIAVETFITLFSDGIVY